MDDFCLKKGDSWPTQVSLECSFLQTAKVKIINKPESIKSLAQKTDIQPQISVEEHICIIIIKCPPFFSFVSSSFC